MVRPETTRSNTSVSQTIGSMPFSFAVWITEPTTQWLATMSAELRAAVAALLSPPTCGEGVKDPDISG